MAHAMKLAITWLIKKL